MIDEIFEVKQYLKGVNVSKQNLYRTCYLLVKWYKELGSKKIEVRAALFEWGKKYNFYIKYNVNDIIDTVFERNSPNLKSPEIKINKNDVKNINKRFDNKNTKLVALAVLCYAKAFANEDGEFSLTSVGLSSWLNINRQSIRKKYIKELIEYEFVSEVSKPERIKNKNDWGKPYEEQSTRYKINMPLNNSGDFVLRNNEIGKLFSEVFAASPNDRL